MEELKGQGSELKTARWERFKEASWRDLGRFDMIEEEEEKKKKRRRR